MLNEDTQVSFEIYKLFQKQNCYRSTLNVFISYGFILNTILLSSKDICFPSSSIKFVSHAFFYIFIEG